MVCNVADVREAELSALVTNAQRAMNTVLLEAAEDACVSHGRSGADCATAVRARDLQITELHRGILEAVTISELDAAEQACADAVAEVDLTQCASLVAQRRPEIETSLLERVRAAASLSQVDALTEECEQAFVSCTTVADLRKAEIETVLADVPTVPNLYLLDAALAASAGMQMERFSGEKLASYFVTRVKLERAILKLMKRLSFANPRFECENQRRSRTSFEIVELFVLAMVNYHSIMYSLRVRILLPPWRHFSLR